MDISDATQSASGAFQLGIQKQVLDNMKTQSAMVSSMLAAGQPAASVNSPSQGHNIDAFA